MSGRSATTCAHSACARNSSAKRTCAPTSDAIERLGIDRASDTGKLLIECGFEAFERDDGLHPESPAIPPERHAKLRYNQYLNALGYDGPNPWHTWANSWEDSDGTIRSGLAA